MAHRHDVYKYGIYIEHEYKCAGKYGAKGEKRAPRKKITPEQMHRQNQWQKEKIVLRKLRCNFTIGDLWVTLKFPKGTKMTGEQLRGVWKGFSRKLRDSYKKRKQILKFIYRMEIGERGGVHIHLVANRLEGTPGTAEVVSGIWQQYGKFSNYTPLYEDGNFKELASYITKPLDEEISGQLTLFGGEEERKTFSQYGCSRNLVLPEKEHHEYKRRTIRKLVENGPVPTPGYYIDRDSIYYGVNPYTGETYYYYTEIMLCGQQEDIWEADG